MQFEKLSEKQKKWLTDTARKMDMAVSELVDAIKTEDMKEIAKKTAKVKNAIFKHISAKHKIAKTYYSDEFTKDLRLTEYMIALAIEKEYSIDLKDMLYEPESEEELEWLMGR